MITNVEAVFFDLDDTLWAVAPVIHRAERKIYTYLQEHFPRLTDAMDLEEIRKVRSQVYASRPDLAHDLTTSRRLAFESLLSDFDYDPQAAVALTDLFLDYRNRVALYSDVIPALERLRNHFKLVVVTNGNADIERVGIGEFSQPKSAPRKRVAANHWPEFSNSRAARSMWNLLQWFMWGIIRSMISRVLSELEFDRSG